MKLAKLIILLLIWMLLIFSTGCAAGSGIERAVARGDLDAVQRYLEEDPGALKRIGQKGFTLLHLAADEGQTRVAEFLLDKGLPPDFKGRVPGFVTPLYLAAEKGRVETLRLLAQRGAQLQMINRRKKSRWTPLSAAIISGHTPAVKALLEAGADPNFAAKDSMPLVMAAWYGDLEMVRILVRGGAEIDSFAWGSITALFAAVEKGKLDIVKFLVEKGAKVNHRVYYNLTPLHYTVYWKKQRPRVARYLIEQGAEINAVMDWGATPLHFAARYGYVDCARLFLENGADTDIEDKRGKSPLDRATRYGRNNMLRLISAPHRAAGKGKLDELKKLIQTYPTLLDARDEEGKTPLHLAVENGRFETAQWLLEQGADVHALSRFRKVEMLSGMIGKIVVPRVGRVKWLTHEISPLDIAVEKGDQRLIALLKEHSGEKGDAFSRGEKKTGSEPRANGAG